tara:strand:- start:1400 stop:1954 length:555 start_codon:yes stop_codon:yes gene_type:complete
MSSNIQIERVCQYCNNVFTARTTTTKYCSQKCGGKAYKDRKRAEKIGKVVNEVNQVVKQPIEEIKEKEFLSINEVSKLIGISRRTIYRLIDRNELTKIKIGTRTIIKRSELNKYLEQPKEIPKVKNDKPVSFNVSDYYNLTDIKSKYGISEKALYDTIKRNNITKVKKGWYAYVSKQIIDELLT